MKNDTIDKNKNDRIQALKERGFEYAVAYLENPVVYQDLTLQDFSALSFLGRLQCGTIFESINERGITIKGKYFDRESLDEMVSQTIPESIHAYLTIKNVQRGPSAEEIFIIDDLYRTQDINGIVDSNDMSDRFDEQTLGCIPRSERRRLTVPFTDTQDFVNLMTGPYLLIPLPAGIKTSFSLKGVMNAVAQQQKTPELEQYVKDVLRKTGDLCGELEKQYMIIRTSDEVNKAFCRSKEEGSLVVKRLQDEAGFDLRGYEPTKEYSAYEMWTMYGQVVKDGVFDVRSIKSSLINPSWPNTEMQTWMRARISEIIEQLRIDSPFMFM